MLYWTLLQFRMVALWPKGNCIWLWWSFSPTRIKLQDQYCCPDAYLGNTLRSARIIDKVSASFLKETEHKAQCQSVIMRCSSGCTNMFRMETLRPRVSDFEDRPESLRAAGNSCWEQPKSKRTRSQVSWCWSVGLWVGLWLKVTQYKTLNSYIVPAPLFQ